MANTNFPPQSSKARGIKGFAHLYIYFLYMVSQEVVSHFKVFHSFVEHWVFCYRDGTGVITHEGNSLKNHSKVPHAVHNPRIWEQQLHTQPPWWIEQLKIISEKTSKQERIRENDKYQKCSFGQYHFQQNQHSKSQQDLVKKNQNIKSQTQEFV
jgi:hypothetical protein